MTDHTLLIEIFAESDAHFQSQLAKLLAAKPPHHIIRRYVEAWGYITEAINDLSLSGRECRAVPEPYDPIGRLEQRLEVIAQQIEGFTKEKKEKAE